MRELLLIAGAGVFAMAIVAGSVVVGHDTTTFVSPPEAVVEDFVRQLAAGRYDRGVRHLEERRSGAARLEAEGQALRARAGDVNQVEGEPGAMDGETATAAARIETSRAGELVWTFRLRRGGGGWKIVDWSSGS